MSYVLKYSSKAPITFSKKLPQVACSKISESGFAFESEELKLSMSLSKAPVTPGHQKLEISGQIPANTNSLILDGFKLPKQTGWALANGIQCWSSSPILSKKETLFKENDPLQVFFGDDSIIEYPEKPGCFHSWAFSYAGTIDNAANCFFASISDANFLAGFYFDLQSGTFSIFIDCDKGIQDASQQLDVNLAFIIPDSTQNESINLKSAFGSYQKEFSSFANKPATEKAKTTLGYTSWYYKYRDISPEWLVKNLIALEKKPDWEVFQIDDGYQKNVGDWLILKDTFQDALPSLVQKIKAFGKKPGIWLAPFIALEHSKTFKIHPDWLLKDDTGQLVLCGDFPHWGGKFYALDPFHQGVQGYLRQVFDYYFKEIGFEFLKADFLYSVAKVPHNQMTRGIAGFKAIEWLYNLCKEYNVTFLSCGSVLSQSFLNCDFARIGPDISLEWEVQEKIATTSREKVSTKSSIVNAITRYPLDKVMHGNDPDVYMLREDTNQLNWGQCQLLAEVNSKLGSLIFTSDLVSDYESQRAREMEKVGITAKEQRPFKNLQISFSSEGKIKVEGDGQSLVNFA